MKIFQDKTTDLDLNGPILSFTTEPTGVGSTGVAPGSTGGGTVSITGIAASSFQGNEYADNSGIITYRWYEEGVGALSDSTYITGTATTTLTLSNLITPNDNQRKFYLQVDYIPSYYETGNASNEPFNSGIATVTVDPLIEIVAQPSNQTTLINSSTGVYATGQFISFTVDADLSDSYFTDDLTYQWFIDGEAATDEVRTKTTTTGSTVSGPIDLTFTSQSSHQFPSVAIENVEITVAGARAGNGGSDSGGPGGQGTSGRAGRFSLPSPGFLGKNIDFYVGYMGNGGSSGSNPTTRGAGGSLPNSTEGDGGLGGSAGNAGWSGGGGGGGAATYVENIEGRFIVAGGGGGGGGGSWNRGGNPGHADGKTFVGRGGSVASSNGGMGNTLGFGPGGDGGGGGGGGGGSPGGGGANHGLDNTLRAKGGDGGGSRHDNTRSTLLSQWTNTGNGYVNLKYTGYTSQTVTTNRKTSISGSTSATLKLACDTVGIQTAQCKISSATASNSYIMSDEVTAVFTSSTADNEIKIESIGVTDTATLTDINLNNGEYTFNLEGTDADNNGINQYYVFYSPNKSMEVEMDLYGGVGDNKNQRNGGEGGYSRIRFTMTQNTEYVIAGLISSINAPFLYRTYELLACVGQGGSAGTTGRGGAGGGIDVAGEDGVGSNRGQGGARISAGNLGGNGRFGGSYPGNLVYPGDIALAGREGGQTIKCSKGVYWRQQGVSACNNTGDVKFVLDNGIEVTNTTKSIYRGFKPGYNILQTAGKGFSSTAGGMGGNGATGGQGTGSNGGGGGGSGYTSGSVTVVDTRLGGSDGTAKVVLRLQS